MAWLLPLFFIPLFVIASPAHAQLSVNEFTSRPEIILTPSFPEPQSEFTARLNEAGTASFGAVVEWYVDDELMSSAQNQREIKLLAGRSGSPMTIRAKLIQPDNSVLAAEKILTPHYLDVIIEPQTKTPAFYRGRSLPSFRSQINATALLDGGGVNDPSLIYQWSINDEVIGSGGMRGQNQISFTMPTSEARLTVSVTKIGQGVIARHIMTIKETMPMVRFYEINPLFGQFTRSLSTLTILSNSTTVRAEPYYLDTRVYNEPSILEWTLGGTLLQANSNPYEVTLVRQQSTSPTVASFHVRNAREVLQGAVGDFLVQ